MRRHGAHPPGMDEFSIHTADSAPQASREALGRLEQNVGFIPNLAATIAGSPPALQAFVAMQSSLRGTGLAPAEREIVGLTVSRENSSPYSLAAHSTFAERVGLAPDAIAALRNGRTCLTPAKRRCTRSPASCCARAATCPPRRSQTSSQPATRGRTSSRS